MAAWALAPFNLPGNALIALAAAASWGGGDFCGGMGVKAANGLGTPTAVALRVVIVAHAVSLIVLLVVLAGVGGVWPLAVWPHGALLGWGLGAGVAAGVSLTAFYLALSRGAMGASAAVSGLLAAAIPAVVSTAIEGAPAALRVVGFALAAAAIWMIAAGPSPENVAGAGGRGEARKTMALAVVGGLGFGFYFVALRMDNPLGVFEPMALARVGSVATCAVLLGVVALGGGGRSRETQIPFGNDNKKGKSNGKSGGGGAHETQIPFGNDNQKNKSNHSSREAHAARWLSKTAVGWALGVALLDTGGNLLFVWATRMGRLDVAAVLASLYPASTILLAAWRLHERPTRRQMAGMGMALAAVVMITV